jgi:FKBP-type peptidyl-prolyl cis-trans isomerase SlyD
VTRRRKKVGSRRISRRFSGAAVAEPGSVAVIQYRVFDATDRLVGASEHPTEFLLGHGALPSGLEAALRTMSVGQRRCINLAPEQGFGVRDPEAVIWVDKDEFVDDVAEGDQFEAETDCGELVLLTVLEVLEETVALDTNPPLAGQTVRVELTLEALFPASRERLRAATARFGGCAKPSEPLIAPSRLLEGGGQRYENNRADRHGGQRPSPGPNLGKRRSES